MSAPEEENTPVEPTLTEEAAQEVEEPVVESVGETEEPQAEAETAPDVEQETEIVPETSEEPADEANDNEVQADAALITWLQERITIPNYTSNMWNEEHQLLVSDFFSNPSVTKLVAYMDKDIGLVMHTATVPVLRRIPCLQYFLKPGEDTSITTENVNKTVQFGVCSGNAMASLLNLMNSVYLPSFVSNNTWPESVKREFSGQLHKFMASLTETANQVKGHTVLYLPDEDGIQELLQSDLSPSSLDKYKDLIQHLESTLIHWTRQIKEVVMNQETSQQIDNAGPLEEIEFWRSRTVDLSGIRSQLDRKGVQDIVKLLHVANSSYLKPFEILSTLIQQGSIEAQNNLKFLSALETPCLKLAEASPENIPSILPDILNLIRMIWTISQFYNTDERVTGLLRKVSNQLIVQCSKKINLGEIFDGDVLESMLHLKESIKCGEAWHRIYVETTEAIANDTKHAGKWDFDPSTHGIFAQIDAFVQRCHNLMEVCEGQLQFARKNLVKEKGKRAPLPCFGGSRGSEVEKSLYEIEEAFEKYIDRLRKLDYDILNVKATNWHYDYNYFKNGLKDLEVMMSNVISSAWEGVATVSDGVNILESFYYLAVRPGMKQSVERKTAEVYQMFSSEVKKVKSDFDRNKKDPPLPYGQPRFAGAALWAKSLLTRVKHDYEVLEAAHYLADLPEATEATNAYEQISSVLEGYMKQMHSEWLEALQSADGKLEERLERSLISKADDFSEPKKKKDGQIATTKKTGDGQLLSNFDKGLLRMFKEVRYWGKFHGDYPVPYIAHEMAASQDELRALRESVMLVVRDYNTIVDTLSVEERRLFSEHLRRVDRKIAPGLSKLTWGEKHIKDWFVRVCRGFAQEVYDIVLQFQENNERINHNCERIANCLLVDIEKNVVYDDVVFEERQIQHQTLVKSELKLAHDDIVATIKSSYEFFRDHPKEIQREWVKYIKKTDQKVEDALRTTVKKSLQELSRAINGDAKSEPHALFKVNMILDESKGTVEFRPSMSDLSLMVKQMSRQSITTIQVVPRLNEVLTASSFGESPEVKFDGKTKDEDSNTLSPSAAAQKTKMKNVNFYDVISNDDDILKIMVNIMHGTQDVAVDLGKIISHYDRYQPIWNTDKTAFIRRYANTKRPLASFDMDITRYKNHQQDIQSEDQTHNVQFIRIDCALLKKSLVGHCQQWQHKLTTLLHHNSTTELYSLHDLMDGNTSKLTKVPKNLENLSTSINLLKGLRLEEKDIEGRFEPVEDMYKCLDKFDVHVSDEEKEKLEAIRPKWIQFKQTLVEADEMLSGKKSEFRKGLEEDITRFSQTVVDTRDDFLNLGPFSAPGPGEGNPDVEGAFAFIADCRKRIADNRAKALSMKSGMELFNIPTTEYQETEDTEKELNQLDYIWTQMKTWLDTFDNWKTGKFSNLNTKELDKEAQVFIKDITKVPRYVKGWKVWKSLNNIIQQFRQTLPLIANLRAEGMRDRHWEQLQDEIQQQFDPHAEDFTLEKVNGLGLHLHADAISQLATVASREMAIEINLKDIKEIWTDLPLELVEYKGKYWRIKTIEDINENLEQHQLGLSTMKNSPYFLTFATDINYWIKTLNDISETVEMIMNVQRTWMYLESIFMDSADIRKQLPAESSMFEKVNNGWIESSNKLAEDKKALGLLLEGLFDRLTRMNDTLDRINKSLDQYLEKKRQLFPRFYFLSNDDLLEILGNSRDPMAVQKHIRKFFAGIVKLELTAPAKGGPKTWEINGMHDEGVEGVKFINTVAVEGAVEAWMDVVERTMFDTLKKLLLQAMSHVAKSGQKKKAGLETWVRQVIGSHVILSGQIAWTNRVTQALAELTKNKRSVKRLKNEWNDYLSKLAKYVKNSDLTKIEKARLVALVTIEVHARDVIDKLKQVAAKGKASINMFEWTSQLRFYFLKDVGDYGICEVRQTNTIHPYGYEYQGNNGRLVVTPLTDRCYMTLTTALFLCKGGCPMGPAGTGKTETVKDLGKNLGKFVVVFNCSPTMGVDSLEKNFSGLAQTGSWGCFDEFNRIIVEVLSVVALQVMSILDAVKQKVDKFVFQGTLIKLRLSVGIFVTMNPAGAGYTGRSKLPDNLKSLFRPVAMMTPDEQMIADVMLRSIGFQTADVLAKKIVSIYDMMTQQLSKQDHYAGGLRAIGGVVKRAGQLDKIKAPEDSEELVMMKALSDMNHSKLILEDRYLFDNLIGDLFPNVEMPEDTGGALRDELCKQLEIRGLQIHEEQMKKIIQLKNSMGTRHSNMLVGQTCSGKSIGWQVLSKATTVLAERKVEDYTPVDELILNPKVVNDDELYGYYDPATKEWSDGLLSVIMRKACQSETPNKKWIILDGPVDTLWIESMNTVMDDNKVLTLVNGDRISLSPQTCLLFEVQDLSVASPATVSRAGMVYLDQSSMGWWPMVTSWLEDKQRQLENPKAKDPKGGLNDGKCQECMTTEGVAFIKSLFEKYVVPITTLIRERDDIVALIKHEEFSNVRGICRMFDSLVSYENGVDKADEGSYTKMLEMWFVFCTIWSIGGPLTKASREKFDPAIREIESLFPPLLTVFDYFVDVQKKDWSPWTDKVNAGWRPQAGAPFFNIVVPTADTICHNFVMNTLIMNKHAVLVFGGTGTGKSMGIQNLLDNCPDSILTATLNFSSATSSPGLQDMLETRLEKRLGINFGPSGGKASLIAFVDDLNMPKKEAEGGCQPPIQLLRQLMDYGFWYDRLKKTKKIVMDTQIVAAMGPPGGSRSMISTQLQSRFSAFNFPQPNDATLKRIFGVLISNHLLNFDESVKPLGTIITQATVDLYKQVAVDFLPTPACCHYLFNMRDIAKVFQGILQSKSRNFDTREGMIRLWVHECLRVFSDRLVDEKDRERFIDIINSKLNGPFESGWKKLFETNQSFPLFGSFLDDDTPAVIGGNDDEVDDGTNPYQDLTQKCQQTKDFFNEKLELYNLDTDKIRMDLVLFDMAIDHVVRIFRILSLPRGNAMLVGVGGSGRQSLTRLAAYSCGQKVKQIAPTKNYRVQDWREDIKELYRQTGVELEATVFLFNDNQIVDDSFMEDLNNILNSGEIPKLFPPDELGPIMEDLRADATKDGRSTTSDGLYAYFIERVREQLHIVIAMSPVGAGFRNYCRMFPALVNCCTIDWFNAWPEQALQDVAYRFLGSIDVGGQKNLEGLSTCFSLFQKSASAQSDTMLLTVKRFNYITPTKYLDLVNGFITVLKEKRKVIEDSSTKLKNGLDKLDESSEQVKVMSVELESKTKIVAEKKIQCEKLLVEIVQKQRAADEQKKEVEVEAAKTEIEAAECGEIAAEAQKDLDKATPALEKAVQALSKLTKNAVTEVKSYSKPPKAVEKVMSAVMIILEKDTSWPSAKKELSNPNFLNTLKDFDKDAISNHVLKLIGKYTKQKDFNADEIGNVSLAAGALCDWVCAMELYAKVFRDVEPKRLALAKAQDKLAIKEASLAESKNLLAEVIAKVKSLEDTYTRNENEKNALIEEAGNLESKLVRANELVDGLSGEKVRWQVSIESYAVDLVNVVGDCALSSAFLSYAGPFDTGFRQTLLTTWLGAIKKMALPFTKGFTFVKFLANPTDVLDWGIQGLPSDDFSVENGVLVERGRRWPLCIDPQVQANMWIKNKEKELKALDFRTKQYMSLIEQAIQYGTCILVQDIMEDIESSLEPLLRLIQGGEGERKSIQLGDKELTYSPSFRLYFSTKLQNPHYKPEVSAVTTVINFAVKEKGLQDQLLGVVVKFEEPQLETEKDNLVKTVAGGKRKLQELEDQILSLLSSSTGNLLDDVNLINVLNQSKVTSTEVKASLAISVETEEKIDLAREGYRPIAAQAALCFFVINDLSVVDPMYQFSLKGYVELFKQSIVKSAEDTKMETPELSERIRILNAFHTEAVYNYTCRALFERHKLLLAFQLTAKKMQVENKIDPAEFEFFLKGGVVMDRSQRQPNPCPEWLSEVAWDNITELDKINGFSGIASSFETNATDWREWYQAKDPPPEKVLPPGDWTSGLKMDDFKQMLVLRCIRLDRVVYAARSFIANNLGEQFTVAPPFDLKAIYETSDYSTPLVFVLSPGIDPTIILQPLADKENQKLDVLALGQGQTPIALQLLEQAKKNGTWLLLANCHLSLGWLPDLEKIVEQFSLETPKPHPDFRLWLSSDPSPQFPISLLQASVKMTTEPPKGIKANILRLYQNMTEERMTLCECQHKYKKLVFALCFFHALLIERRKFQSLGWCIAYDFNDADYLVCENLLAVYLDIYEETPWDAMKYLIAQANYGGRVTDSEDRKLLVVYSNQFFCDQAINTPNYQLSSVDTYYIPDDGDKESYIQYIKELPNADADPPEAFGQHPNADISSQIGETTMLLDTILQMQPKAAPKEGAAGPDEVVFDLCTKLMDQIPNVFNTKEIKKKFAGDTAPLTVVLQQEIDRYNVLLAKCLINLQDLQKGIKGLVVISAELEQIFDAVFDNKVPGSWGTSYYSIKPLGSWVRDLMLRIEQLRLWVEEGPPKVFWISGFTFPTGFLTALLQNSARKNSVSIDTLGWEFLVMSHNEGAINLQPKEGAYIKGLFLEGARWDTDAGCLAEPLPMELTCSMPVIHFKPVEGKKKIGKGLHGTPCYMYPVRTGSRERPSYMLEVELKCGARNSETWTKRGIALLMSLAN